MGPSDCALSAKTIRKSSKAMKETDFAFDGPENLYGFKPTDWVLIVKDLF